MGLTKILQYGFLAFVFLLPFQTVFLLREPFIDGQKWQYGIIGVYAIDILLLAILGVAIVRWRESIVYHVLRIKYETTEVALILLVAWSGLSVFWAEDQMLAGYFSLKLVFGAAIFLVARTLDSSVLKKVIFVLLLAGVAQSIIGIGQFVYQYSPTSTWLGMSAHITSQAGSSVLKIDGERFLRAYGTFPHPNMLGGFLAVVLVLGLGYSTFIRRNDISAEMGKPKYQGSLIPHPSSNFILYLSSLIIILLGLILTFSRTSWLGAVLGIVVLTVWFSLQQKCTIIPRPWNYGTFFKTCFVLIIAVIIFVFVLREQVFPRFDGATIEREGSVSERVQSFYDAKTVMDQEPLFFGTGVGNFTERLISLETWRPVWTLQPVHNVVVLILAEIGVIGLFLWFIFLGTILISLKKSLIPLGKEEGRVRVIFGITLLVLLPSLFFDHWLWSSHFGIFFSFLLLGLSQGKDESIIN